MPEGTDDGEQARLRPDWLKKDQQALSHIRLRIADSLLVYIGGAKTAKEAWDTLQQTFQPKGIISQVTARRKFFRAECPEGGDIAEHIRHMRSLLDEIHTVSETTVISDAEFAITLLVSLPESWNNFIQSIDSTATSTLTSASIIARILQEDRRRKERDSASGDAALVAKQKKKCTKCFNCGKTGHIRKDCWAKGGGAQDKPKANDAVDEDFGFMAIEMHVDPPADADAEKALAAADESRLWFGDSGATTHVANAREIFQTYREVSGGASISGVGGASRIVGRGSVKLRCKTDEGIRTTWLHNVAHVPGAPHNLLSLTRADDAKCKYIGENGTLRLYSPSGKLLMVGHKPEGPGQLYRMSVAAEAADEAYAATLGKRTWEQFHRAMGHVNIAALKRLRLMAEGMDVDESSDDKFQCEPCVRAKQHVEPFPQEATRTPEKIQIGEIVVSDVWGPAQVRSVHGYYYAMTFTDLASRFSAVYFSATKSNWSTGALKEFENMIRSMSRTGSQITCLRIDNGTEYINKVFKQYCKSQGIKIETTAPHSPAQNGVAERLNRTLIESARAMLLAKDLPKRFWPEAVSYAAHVENRVPHAALKDKTPYEALTGQKPDISGFHEFGSKCWVLDQSGDRGKLDAKSKPCLFMGFAENSKAYRLWDPAKRTFVKSRNVIFEALKPELEEILPPPSSAPKGESKDEDGGSRASGKEVADVPSSKLEKSSARDAKSTAVAGGVPGTPANQGAPAAPAIKADIPNRQRSTRLASKPPVDYRHLHNPQARGARQPKGASEEPLQGVPADADDVAEMAFLGVDAGEDDPKFYQEAVSGPDADHWKAAMQAELDQLHEMGTWDLVERPAERSVIGCKWVFRIKRDSEGRIVKYKARLVAQGFSQKEGIDYFETYAPVMRMESLRTLLAIGTELDLEIDTVDAVGAYLNGKLSVDVYMRQPIGFDDGSGRVCKLKLALYGLKQSGREWNTVIDSYLRERGFRACVSDPCVYTREDTTGSKTFIAMHVDDFTLLTKDRESMTAVKAELMDRFKITDLGPVRQIVGLEVVRDRENHTLTLRQSAYIRKVLARFGMENSHPVSVPMDPSARLNKAPEGASYPNMAGCPYRELVGSLMYATVGTRPDISYAVQTLSQFMENPMPAHWSAGKRVLRYLQGTQDWGILYRASSTESTLPTVSGYSDADWGANPDDRKSISGYVFHMAGAPISWASRKQKSVALSSMEAEYMAGSSAASQALWTRMLLEELGFPQRAPTLLQMDNQSALALTRNTGTQGRAKHIAIRYHFIRDHIQTEEITVSHCAGEDNPADIFTKPLARPKFERFREMLGMSALRGSVEN